MESLPYYRPRSLIDAFELLAAVSDARWIAGGTDLLVQARKRSQSCGLISLRSIEELGNITTEPDGGLRIGAAMVLSDVRKNRAVRKSCPVLCEAIDVLGSRQIRNVATLGGNLCNASPAADTAPALLALDARVELVSADSRRELPLHDFILGPGKTALKVGEILSALLVPSQLESGACGQAFIRKGRVKMDLAIVSLAVSLSMDGDRCRDIRVAAGAVAPVPLRLIAAEDLLRDTELDDVAIAAAKESAMATVSPIDDQRASAFYRRQLVGVFLERAVRRAAGLAGGESV